MQVSFHHICILLFILTKHKTLALGALRAPNAKVLCFVVLENWISPNPISQSSSVKLNGLPFVASKR